MSTWFSPNETIRSLGSQHESKGGLAGLHQARQEHLGQFFTPESVVRFMWDVAEPAMAAALGRAPGAKIALYDNSMGVGGLFRFADPAKHRLAGLDVHAPSVVAAAAAVRAAGFEFDFVRASMADVHPGGHGVSFINPPFSVHLESPALAAYECCTFGRFGPNTACQSESYALAQALTAAQIVVAVLPASFARDLPGDSDFSRRLVWVGQLPRDTFKSEGADVETAVAVFGPKEHAGQVDYVRLTELVAPRLDLFCDTTARRTPRALADDLLGTETILRPVTGDRRVRVAHHNRRIVLQFSCGLVEAKVRNAVLRRRVHAQVSVGPRRPANLRWNGEGLLDLQVHLLQPDPLASFENLVEAIRDAGGEPEVYAGVRGYFRRLVRQYQRHCEPFSHTVRVPSGALAQAVPVKVKAHKTFLLDPQRWGSPAIKVGQEVVATPLAEGGRWELSLAGKRVGYTTEELLQKFSAPETAAGDGWVRKFHGRAARFPALAHDWETRARKLGLHHWLSFKYQFTDLIELALAPMGGVVGWQMGLGKARLAIALCLLRGGKHSLIVVEPHLVDEMETELKGLPLPPDTWQIIRNAAGLRTLRPINVIAYSRLRTAVAPAQPRRTYAVALARRISLIVADEGHLLRHGETDQSRALRQIKARRRFVLTGTPIANYPRDLLAVLSFVFGSYGPGTAFQPYGMRGVFLEPALAQSVAYARRGVDEFAEHFVTTVWSTNEFKENLDEGAKREIPRIANLPQFRALVAPLVLRRIIEEPEVADCVTIPVPTLRVNTVAWDPAHLAFYVRTADEFAEWYKKAAEASGRKNVSLITILARIGAVDAALNHPAGGVRGIGSHMGVTSKEAAIVARVQDFVAEGRKTIVYARSPGEIMRLARLLKAEGIESVLLHGGIPQVARTVTLREQFRFGPVPVLLATLGTSQSGLNIPESTRVIFSARSWTARAERQAMARVLRPQQKGDVLVEFFHLPGSLDEYQAQMVDFKQDASDAGLDWATPTLDDVEFTHIDTILGRFVRELPGVRRAARQPEAAVA